jgi:hypothetical protein
LENRALLAGNITAAVDGGVLRLIGDAAANGVRIRQSGDNLEVIGTLKGGAVTTINGDASFTASGVINGLIATLHEGNDSIRLANDSGPVTIEGTIVVSTGKGNDSVSGIIKNNNSAVFHLGPGGDRVGLGNSTLGELVINGDPLSADNGSSDEVKLARVRTSSAAIIRTGGGSDRVEIDGASSFPLTLTIATGDGSDRVEIEGTADAPVQVGSALTIETGRGNDEVLLRDVKVNGVLTITNLDGESKVELERVQATDGLFAWLGAGDDELRIRNSSSARAAFGGGLGSDTLTLEANVFGRLNYISF